METHTKVFSGNNRFAFDLAYDRLTNSQDAMKQVTFEYGKCHMQNGWVVVHNFHEGLWEIWKPIVMNEKVVRTLTYEGPTESIEAQLLRCLEDGVHMTGNVKLTIETIEGKKRKGIRPLDGRVVG